MLTLDNFLGGLWIPDEKAPTTEQAGFAVPSTALLQADNVDFLQSGGVRGRRGSSVYNNVALAGAVLAMRRFYARPTGTSAIGISKGSDDDSVGTVPWVNPGGIAYVFDAAQATVTLLGGSPGAQSHYLVAEAPFVDNPIPSDATITGISVYVVWQAALADLEDASVKLFKAGVPVGTEQATSTALELVVADRTYGVGSSDLWGTTWSADEVNAGNFGVGLSLLNNNAGVNSGRVFYVRITVYYTSSLGNSFLVAHRDGGNLVYVKGSGGGFSALASGTVADPGRRPRMVPWPQKGKIFCFDGVSPVLEYDGTKMAVTPTGKVDGITVIQPPRRGPYAALYRNRLYATDPAELAYSVYASDINDETVWRNKNQLALNDDRGGRMTGLEQYGDFLVGFKDTGLWSWQGDPEFGGALSEIARIGCVAPDSVAPTPYGVIFTGRDGVYITDGQAVTSLSAAIRPLFVERDAEHTYTDAVAVYYARRKQLWLRLEDGGDGFILHRVTLPGEGDEQPLLPWSRIPGLKMNCGTNFEGAADQGELYLGDGDGTVWLRDVGNDDGGDPYNAEVLSAQLLIDRERREARVLRIKPIFRAQGALTVGLRYDQVDADDFTGTVGTAGAEPTIQEPRFYVSDKAHFGRFVSFRCISAEGPDFELHRVDLETHHRARGWR